MKEGQSLERRSRSLAQREYSRFRRSSQTLTMLGARLVLVRRLLSGDESMGSPYRTRVEGIPYPLPTGAPLRVVWPAVRPHVTHLPP
jgi:hypothetical protein